MSPWIAVLIVALFAFEIYMQQQIRLRQAGPKALGEGHNWRDRLQNLRDTLRDAVPLAWSRTGRRNPQLSQDFRQWVRDHLDDEPALQAWLLAISDRGFALLTEQLNIFCMEVNLDLRWLVYSEAEIEPRLQAGVRQTAILYCQACHTAYGVQDEVEDFRAYLQSVRHLARLDNPQATQRLLSELREHDFLTTIDPELMIASKEERQAFMERTIRLAIQQDKAAFDAILTRLQNGEKAADNTATTKTTPATNGQG